MNISVTRCVKFEKKENVEEDFKINSYFCEGKSKLLISFHFSLDFVVQVLIRGSRCYLLATIK